MRTVNFAAVILELLIGLQGSLRSQQVGTRDDFAGMETGGDLALQQVEIQRAVALDARYRYLR